MERSRGRAGPGGPQDRRPGGHRSLRGRAARGKDRHQRADPPARHAGRGLHGDCDEAEMTACLAILKDSFREALASRVLWIVLILTTLVLLLAAPAGIKEEKSAKFRRNSVRNWPALVAKIDEQRQGEAPSPGRQVWERFSPELQQSLEEALQETPGDVGGLVVSELIDELNLV